MDPFTIAGIALVVVPSITSHEAAHGFMANKLGDPTARMAGRLTLNPLPHIDLFFTVLLPAFLLLSGSPFIFGGAKPVPVNLYYLRHPRRDWALVGAAGPVTNILLAVFMAAIASFLLHTGIWNRFTPGLGILSVGILVNILLAVFNLLPIPPLDGSRIVQYFLSREALRAYQSIERYGLLILVALLFFVPAFQSFLSHILYFGLLLVTRIFGITGSVFFALQQLSLG